MTVTLPSARDVDARQVGLGALCVAAVALTLVVQLVWMITFDELGFDRAVPQEVFVLLLPAVTLAVGPALVARALYGRRAAVAAGGLVLAGSTALATYTVNFFALCGRPC